jgi:hypothetical protein
LDIRDDIRSFIESRAISKREKLALGNDDNIFELKIVSSLFAMQLVTHVRGVGRAGRKHRPIR